MKGKASKVNSYQDLIVWKKSFSLCKLVYGLTDQFPDSEKFGLISQIRRAAVSIPSNIAEGYSRHSSKEFRQYIGIALGSSSELETQLLLSSELKFGDYQNYATINSLLVEVRKMLVVLRNKI